MAYRRGNKDKKRRINNSGSNWHSEYFGKLLIGNRTILLEVNKEDVHLLQTVFGDTNTMRLRKQEKPTHRPETMLYILCWSGLLFLGSVIYNPILFIVSCPLFLGMAYLMQKVEDAEPDGSSHIAQGGEYI